MLKKYRFEIALFLLAFVAYGNTLTHDYAWDDAIVITENSRVQKGIAGIPEMFKRSNTARLEDQYGFRPITLITLAVEYQLAPDNPFPGHLMNVVYFALLCIFMFATLNLLFKDNGYAKWFSFLITLLFLVHPIHTEVVANIKSRDEILALLFSFLALNFFLRHFDSRKVLPLGLSILFILLAFLSKEGSLSYLGVLPIAVIIFRSGSLKKYLASCVPLVGVFALAGFIVWVTFPEQSNPTGPEGGPEFYLENMFLNNPIFNIKDAGDRIPNAYNLLTIYVKKFLIPYPLVYFSGYNQIPAISGFQFKLLGAIVLPPIILFSPFGN